MQVSSFEDSREPVSGQGQDADQVPAGMRLPTEDESNDDYWWMKYAECAQFPNSRDFFPETNKSDKAAVVICEVCEVRVNCLDFALRHKQPNGIWGGLNHSARDKIEIPPPEVVLLRNLTKSKSSDT